MSLRLIKRQPSIFDRAGQETSSQFAPRILALALLLDVAWGEPPEVLHPVVWMGRLLEWLERRAPAQLRGRLVYGAVVAGLAPLGWAGLGMLAQQLLPWPLQAVLLKPTFAGRALLDATRRVEVALTHRDLATAQQALHALVSRPTSELDRELASAAAIESVAENYVDSWLAPLLAYAVGGLPLAYGYRAANTADAMWGYRSEHYEQLGKATARLDDMLNWLPARLAAVVTCLTSAAPRRALAVWHRDARLTASPNAGQAMAAVAGALDVRLEKIGQYVLNADARLPTPNDIRAARRLIGRAMLASALLLLLLCRATSHDPT